MANFGSLDWWIQTPNGDPGSLESQNQAANDDPGSLDRQIPTSKRDSGTRGRSITASKRRSYGQTWRSLASLALVGGELDGGVGGGNHFPKPQSHPTQAAMGI